MGKTLSWHKKGIDQMVEEHKKVLQKYWPMPSERETRKLYANGLTICMEFFICLLKNF